MAILPLFAQPFKTLHLPPPDSFALQTVVITGANTGLGLETARHVVSLGASKVILGVRTLSKGLSAKADIESTTIRKGVVEVWEVDLGSFASVKAFAARAKSLRRLDTAIMNAGLASQFFNVTTDGWEQQLQVNVLSTALLSLLLLPLMVKTRKTFPLSKPHLVVLGSDMHETSVFEERNSENILEALNNKSNWEKSKSQVAERYATTKLLDFYIASKLSERTPIVDNEPAIIVNVVAPGFCKSQLLTRESPPVVLRILQMLTGRTSQEGAKTIVDAATRGIETHGKYLNHQKITLPGPLVSSEEGSRLVEKVWGEVFEILSVMAPDIRVSL